MNANQERQDLIVSYLQIAPQINDQDSEVIDEIQTLLLNKPISALAKQRLAVQLMREVEAELAQLRRPAR